MYFFFFFDKEVKELIIGSLIGNETLVPSTDSDKVFDYILPSGCQRLHFPEMTAICIKQRLVAGTVSEVYREAQYIDKSGRINLFVLIYQEGDSYNDERKKYNSHFFRVIPFSELKAATGSYKKVIQETWEKKRNDYLIEASTRFLQGKNTFFLGAGVSKSAGLPDWKCLLKRMILSLNESIVDDPIYYSTLKADSNDSPLVMARYIKQACQNSSQGFVSMLRSSLYKNAPKKSPLVRVICSAITTGKVDGVINYNYDDVLEKYLESEGVKYSVVVGETRPNFGAVPILHVHGFVPRTDEDPSFDSKVVLSEDDYHQLYQESYHWSNVETLHSLRYTTCFFIGLSLSDPNLRRLIDISNAFGTKNPAHYAFLHRNDYDQPEKAEYVFYTMGVRVIWFEDYDDITRLLSRVTSAAEKK